MREQEKKVLQTAQKSRKDNKKFLLNLKKQNKQKLDQAFHQAHEEAFAEIDCLTCANCCKTTSPIFRDVDINRIAKHLKMKVADFIEAYLYLDKDEDYVLKSAPCAFLGADNYCSIYEVRPKACAEYPHTDRKNMYQLLELTHKNSLVCPAVAQLVEQMKSTK